MAQREKNKQSAHDQSVREIANRYKRAGWKVRADLPDFPYPPNIKGHIPDVWVTNGKEIRVYEVETSPNEDKEQRAAFRRYADERPERSFKKIIAR